MSRSFIVNGSPHLPGRGDVDEVAAAIIRDLDAIDAAIAGETIKDWSPSGGSGAWLIEMSGDLDLSLHEIGSGITFSATRLNEHGGTLGDIVDRRIADGWFNPATPEEAVATIRALCAEWRAIAGALEPTQRLSSFESQLRDLPDDMTLSARRAVDLGLATLAANGEKDDDFMFVLVNPTAHNAADLTFATSVDDEIILDDTVLQTVCAGLPQACFVKRSTRIPLDMTVEPFAWRAGCQGLPGPVEVMRLIATLDQFVLQAVQ